ITYFATAGKQTALVDNARQEYIADNTSKNDDGTFSRFNALAQENSDIKGWIKIPNSKVDNPVYQTGDNDFYVTHNMKKEPSRYGAVFADYRAEINADKSSQNIVLYGHHMNDSTMFGSLKKYRDINFYKQNPTFEFDTIFKDGDYKVFSVFLTNTLPEHDDGYVFNYRPVEFSSNSAFLSWINEVKRRSLINTPVDIIEGDEILTLSTCIYDFDDARLVVMARRVRDGESADVNVTEAFLNPSPLYPDIWYTKRGQSIPEHVNNLSNDLPTVRPEPPTSSQPGASSNLSSEISGSSSSSVAPPSSESPASSAKPPVTPPDTPSSAVPPPPSSEPSAPPVESVPTPDPTPSPDPTPDPDPTPEPTPDPDPEPTPDPDPEPTPNP
ncbi:MAG: class B sortase, partial [Oscillospiraceae bacterium]